MHRLPEPSGRVAIPVPACSRAVPGTASGLERFNAAPADEAVRTLLACLSSLRWAHRLALHRPYPDLSSLLAASDEAAYDLSPADLTEALAAEALPALPRDTYAAADTALRAGTAAYESRFGHAFVICLDGLSTGEALNHALTGIRSRLANDPDEERPVAAEELRRLARGRLTGALAPGPLPPVPRIRQMRRNPARTADQ
ncbi:2-oxo-4-hydroxy-4-carboxy-5-ureidoimidazoline decarboxylase [Streptomyces sp. NPDC052077]|uniref:2-oxo-4-hydroxy-4-carboxy-5-ureidoimidazoline decarboxylase n=1 Tax=Streptomyces sp. NPDC052077 TaxID=3154757 RepID=UPI0034290E04